MGWHAMDVFYVRLLKWQAGSSLYQQTWIPDADCYEVFNNKEMLEKLFQMSVQSAKDSHSFCEHAVLQHVYEALLGDCTAASRGMLQKTCRERCNQIFDIEEFISGAMASSGEVTEQEAIDAFQMMDVD